MATSNVINLADLPVPDAIVIPDGSTIFKNWLTYLRQQDSTFDALVESDPAYKQGEATAYQLLLAYQRINDAVRAVLLASARGADLDQLGANYSVPRLLIKPGDPAAVPPFEPLFETDDAYRERIQLSWSQLSVAGPRNAYRFFAKSADPAIQDADAYGPETHTQPGVVKVYILSRNGDGQANNELCIKVNAALTADEIRPLTDKVEVYSAGILGYSVNAELEIPEGPDKNTVYQHANEVLNNYLRLSHRINTMVPRSAIYAALQQAGVKRVNLHTPEQDILAKPGMAPWCQKISLTIA
ncbi:baseplate assembly protein [Izhakiella australiensis]|uniref:Baseplate assembly protein n=1 Tax=Izhakiella australiensis TaxID=1926881 RepID=A0A1S8YL04_9GAMM|nr:baseplate J/gp47 family protein [Izhakiella australiensis]OON39779.1 baseplate assembly protein [Izhakiella australiensis]